MAFVILQNCDSLTQLVTLVPPGQCAAKQPLTKTVLGGAMLNRQHFKFNKVTSSVGEVQDVGPICINIDLTSSHLINHGTIYIKLVIPQPEIQTSNLRILIIHTVTDFHIIKL